MPISELLSLFLKRLPNYLKMFGLFRGIQLCIQVEIQARLSGGSSYDPAMIQIRVPGWSEPVNLRRRSSDSAIFWQVVVRQEYAIEQFPQAAWIHALHQRILRRGRIPVIIDCGANIGLAAIWLHHRFPGSKIICIEPEKSNLAMLRANTASYPNIEAIEGGVWREAAWLRIDNPGAGTAGFHLSVATEQETGSIRGYSPYELIRAVSPEPLFAVKMDIEGAESEVFAGNVESWIAEASMIMIEIHDWLLPGRGTSQNLFRALGQYTYDVVLSGENMVLFRLFGDETPRQAWMEDASRKINQPS